MIRAIWHVGWAWLFPAIVITTFFAVALYALIVILEDPVPRLSALAYWVYWISFCYGAMVVLRALDCFTIAMPACWAGSESDRGGAARRCARAWYNRNARVVPTVAEIQIRRTYQRDRTRRLRGSGILSCLLHPICDGPGVALLVFMPPVLFVLTLPVFDWIAIVDPLRRAGLGDGFAGLTNLPPPLVQFHDDPGLHPARPRSDAGRQAPWAKPISRVGPSGTQRRSPKGSAVGSGQALFGVAVGGFPTVLYWMYCGNIDWFDRIVFADLIIMGAGYASMTLAASLLHESLAAANPATVLVAIGRIGWDYVQPRWSPA